MIEVEEYTKFIQEAFACVSPRIKISTVTDFMSYPIVQLHVGPSYMSYETVFAYHIVARTVLFLPVRFEKGTYKMEEWTNVREIDDPENFHKAVYDFIHDLHEYEKREKVFMMEMEARKYAC